MSSGCRRSRKDPFWTPWWRTWFFLILVLISTPVSACLFQLPCFSLSHLLQQSHHLLVRKADVGDMNIRQKLTFVQISSFLFIFLQEIHPLHSSCSVEEMCTRLSEYGLWSLQNHHQTKPKASLLLAISLSHFRPFWQVAGVPEGLVLSQPSLDDISVTGKHATQLYTLICNLDLHTDILRGGPRHPASW